MKFSYESYRFWEPGITGILLVKSPAKYESVPVSMNETDQNRMAQDLNLRLPTLLEVFRAAIKDPLLRENLMSPVRILESGISRLNPDGSYNVAEFSEGNSLHSLSEHGEIVKVQNKSTDPEKTISIPEKGSGPLVFFTNTDYYTREFGARYSIINGYSPNNDNEMCAFIRNYFGPSFPNKIMGFNEMLIQNPNFREEHQIEGLLTVNNPQDIIDAFRALGITTVRQARRIKND